MALQLDDPLSQNLYGLGLQQLTPWNPTEEAARKEKSWGETQQKVGERYARAGLTGSSQELGDLSNIAKDFELDWNERAPKQEQAAIASVLPIQNFRRSVANDFTTEANQNRLLALQGENADMALWGNLLASSGLPTWLIGKLLGTTTPAATKATGTGLLPSLYDKLFGGSDLWPGEGLTQAQLDAMDPAIDWAAAQDYVDWWNYLNTPGDVGGILDKADVIGGLSLSDLTGYY